MSSIHNENEAAGDDDALFTTTDDKATALHLQLRVVEEIYYQNNRHLSSNNNNEGYAAKPKNSRQPHVLVDANGVERVFMSALGLLTRKFINVILASASGSVDMAETAKLLSVPKRRIYDITNVLEGVGMLEKRSKSTVAWRGSETLLGPLLDNHAREVLHQGRHELHEIAREANMLSHFITRLERQNNSINSSMGMYSADIVRGVMAINRQVNSDGSIVDDVENDNATSTMLSQSVLTVHAPFDAVACTIPSTTASGDETMADNSSDNEHQLYVGTKSDVYSNNAENNSDTDSSTHKRRCTFELRQLRHKKAAIVENTKLQIYHLPLSRDKDRPQQLAVMGAHLLQNTEARVVDEALINDVANEADASNVDPAFVDSQLDNREVEDDAVAAAISHLESSQTHIEHDDVDDNAILAVDEATAELLGSIADPTPILDDDNDAAAVDNEHKAANNEQHHNDEDLAVLEGFDPSEGDNVMELESPGKMIAHGEQGWDDVVVNDEGVAEFLVSGSPEAAESTVGV